MKIVLATFGSRGDVQPMLALSLALKSKGHDVLLAAPPEKAAWEKGQRRKALGSRLEEDLRLLEERYA
jgi:UDP:flavonoid glycosyltransferase YjiC (YdhE family)